MPEYTLYHLTLTTLTPLHIGSGVTLLHEYDYAVQDGKTWRIDDAAILDAQDADDPALVERLAVTPPARLLSETDFTPDSPFFRYAIQGAPRSTAEGAPLQAGRAQLQEQLKDAYDRPYLPGSSLKGALRTALGWYAWKVLGLQPEMSRLNRGVKWAAQGYEREIFGDGPNSDALRALHVSDSAPVSPDRLMLLNARVLGKGGRLDTPIELEALRSETVFELDLKLDLALYSEWARRHRLNLSGEGGLGQLPSILNTRALLRAKKEAAWYAGVPGANRLHGFYQQLAKIQPEENQFVVQLGWGTGWEDKTFGERLTAHERFFKAAFMEFRLGRGKGQPGGFPSSRRVAAAYRRDTDALQNDAGENVTEVPAYPLGWALVTFEHARGPAVWTTSLPLEGASAASAAVAAVAATAADAADGQSVSTPRPTPPRRETPQPPAGRGSGQRRDSTPPAPSAKPAPQTRPAPQPKAPQLPVIAFSARPRPGQRFIAEVLEEQKAQVLVEVPGLDPDLWIGAAPHPGGQVGGRLTCEVAGVISDPQVKGGWIVQCRIVER